MSEVSNVKIADAFGYHDFEKFRKISPSVEQNAYLAFNASAAFVSPIIGIARVAIYAAELTSNKEMDVDRRKFAALQIVRGIGEFACLGPIFALVDIVVTIYRNVKSVDKSTVKFTDGFGYHHPTRFSQICKVFTQGGYLAFNILGALISPIIGIARVSLAAYNLWSDEKMSKEERKFLLLQVGRGCAEMLCLGPVMAAADIVFTIDRMINVSEPQSA